MKWPFTHDRQQNKYTVIYITIAALVAMGVSLWVGMQQSVWFDEAYSVIVSKQEPAEIIQLVGVDVHPPAYYLLLHAWGSAFGWGEFPIRLMSVLALGGSIIIAGLLVRRLFGDRAAIVSTAIIAFSPLLLRYGFEIRMYSLASLIGVAATYTLVRARAAGTHALWLWAAYAILLALGILTLYHLALLWLAHVAWLAYVDKKKLKRFWLLPWARAYAVAAILFLPWLPAFVGQLGNGALANIGQPMNIEQLLGVLSFSLFYKPVWQVNVIETIVLVAFIALGVRAWQRSVMHKENKEHLLLLAAYISVPILVFMIASFLRPVYVERYLSHVAIGMMMLTGVLLARMTKSLKLAKQFGAYTLMGAVLMIGVYNLATVGNFNYQRMQKPAVSTAAATIDCAGATVIAADPYVATELSYYLPATCDLRFYSERQTLGGGYAPFSNSPLRISDVHVPILANRLYYAYYGEPTLMIVPAYHQITTRTSGGLTVAIYEAS